jgi:hypothetical protein
MTQLEGILLNLLHDKALLKQEVIGGAHEKFNMFKQLMADEVKNLGAKLSDKRIRMQFIDKGINECHVLAGSDALVFHLHTNVFTLPSEHPFWKHSYLKKDFSKGYFGVIYVYNFLAKSILQQHLDDGGGLIARIFINKDGMFFIEGSQQIAEKYLRLGRHKFNEKTAKEIFLLTAISAVNVDLTIPNYEDVNAISVEQLQEISSNLGIHTAKKLGFQLPNHSEISHFEDEYEE